MQTNTELSTTIEQVNTYLVAYPVVADFKFLKGKNGKPPTRDTVVIKITDSAGNVGWGQSIPSHTWSYETIQSVKSTIDLYLAPALIGANPFDFKSIHNIMQRTIAPSFSTGQPICKAGIDLALFDLTGRAHKQSAAERWKKNGLKKIQLSWTISVTQLDGVGEQVELARKKGFRNFNVKVGRDPNFDLKLCKELRRLAPNAFIWIDANGGYDLDTAHRLAPRFADLGISAFEQPLPANRLSWYKKLKKQKALPILMDEPIVSLTDLEEFHQLGLLDGVAMKVARCAGLTEAEKILKFITDNGLLFYASGLTDPDLAFAACLQLFGAYRLKHPAALNAPQFLTGSILKSPITVKGDQAYLPVGHGLGVEVDEQRLVSGKLDS